MRGKKKKIHRYAEGTTVPVERSKQEIEKLVRLHGAAGFASSWDRDRYVIMFDMRKRRIRFDIGAPDPKVYREKKRWDAEERRRWRALLLILKAKLELIESNDADFEVEFLANLVIAGGQTVGAHIIPQLEILLNTGEMPPLLPQGGSSGG